MLTTRFEDLWNGLVGAWYRYQDAPRTPDKVTQLAATRIALDEVRSEIAVERAVIGVPVVTNRVPEPAAQRRREMLIHQTLARS
ncbi:MAG: hypothetical protein GY720_20015 [bacterium]|nr:hypothetical protein [bacterium]